MSTVAITFEVTSTVTIKFNKEDWPAYTEKEFIADAKELACISLARENKAMLWGRPAQKWVYFQSDPQDFNIDDGLMEVEEE